MLTQSRETLEKAARLLEESAQHLIRLAFKAHRCPHCGVTMRREQFMLSCPSCGLCASDSDEPTADFSEVLPDTDTSIVPAVPRHGGAR